MNWCASGMAPSLARRGRLPRLRVGEDSLACASGKAPSLARRGRLPRLRVGEDSLACASGFYFVDVVNDGLGICKVCAELDRSPSSNLPIDPKPTKNASNFLERNRFVSMPIHFSDSIRSSMRSIVESHVQLDSTASILETTLIRNGTYCGRRFVLQGFSLIWFQEEGQIKLYSPEGQLMQSTDIQSFCIYPAPAVEYRRAA
jgi:hypothetical protein